MKQKTILICTAIAVLGFASSIFTTPAALAAGTPTAPKTVRSVSDTDSKNPNYWFQKGALVATYGNNQAAVRYFGKAIALNPKHSGAYFSQGVAYGQLGNYPRAIADITRAIEMEPANGLYYYGRGRTQLLAGDKEKALSDLRRAADLGDEDAQAYLKSGK